MLRPWLFIDSSTIDPQTSRKVSAAVSNCTLKEKKGTMKRSNVWIHLVIFLLISIHLASIKYTLNKLLEIGKIWILCGTVPIIDIFTNWLMSFVDFSETPLMLDAPVSGGVLAADSGTLTFMVRDCFFIFQISKTKCWWCDYGYLGWKTQALGCWKKSM